MGMMIFQCWDTQTAQRKTLPPFTIDDPGMTIPDPMIIPAQSILL